jgi:glycosyltransferase involved in cell wall biosynthesis
MCPRHESFAAYLNDSERYLVAALLAKGHQVTVLAPADGSQKFLQKMGAEFTALRMDVGGINPLRDLRLLWRFNKVLACQRPDVVLGFTIKNNLYGAMAAKWLGIPFIPNVTGLGTAFLSGGVLQMIAENLYRAAFKSLPVVFFQNEDDAQLFVRRNLVRRAQAHVIPGSGIDLKRFAIADYPHPDLPPTFLMIARILRDKGVFEFVEAAEIVRARYPNARFQLIGKADSKNRTAISEAQVLEWGNSHRIEYLGEVEDVRPSIASAHCIVLPSYREGAPRTLIEAAAMARPLIATDVPGCRAVVHPEENGFLCAPRDARDLANACLRFLDLPREAQVELGLASRRKMEREYDEKIVINAYREAIAGLCSAPADGAISQPHRQRTKKARTWNRCSPRH